VKALALSLIQTLLNLLPKITAFFNHNMVSNFLKFILQ
jgi:hypothetical protein